MHHRQRRGTRAPSRALAKNSRILQAHAARYRALAAAGHLPVPPAPAVPITSSRFFTRKSPTQPPQLTAMGHNLLVAAVAVAAFGLAYGILHPEAAPNDPIPDDYDPNDPDNNGYWCFLYGGRFVIEPGGITFCAPQS